MGLETVYGGFGCLGDKTHSAVGLGVLLMEKRKVDPVGSWVDLGSAISRDFRPI